MTFLHLNLSLHLKSDEGHIERFAFYVYMSSIPIFTKIKQPFALHKFFLVWHLCRYSEYLKTKWFALIFKFQRNPSKFIFWLKENPCSFIHFSLMNVLVYVVNQARAFISWSCSKWNLILSANCLFWRFPKLVDFLLILTKYRLFSGIIDCRWQERFCLLFSK